MAKKEKSLLDELTAYYRSQAAYQPKSQQSSDANKNNSYYEQFLLDMKRQKEADLAAQKQQEAKISAQQKMAQQAAQKKAEQEAAQKEAAQRLAQQKAQREAEQKAAQQKMAQQAAQKKADRETIREEMTQRLKDGEDVDWGKLSSSMARRWKDGEDIEGEDDFLAEYPWAADMWWKKRGTEQENTTDNEAPATEQETPQTSATEEKSALASALEEQLTTSRTPNPELEATLNRLLEDYNNLRAYTPKTREELLQQAENEFASQYEQLRLAAQQEQERSDIALQQQREGLKDTYDRQREASDKEYRRAYSQADKQMLSRGMQRSSYAGQTLSNLAREGVEANQRLWDTQATAEGNIDAQRAQLARQLADQLRQYDTAEASDILARVRQLESEDYQRELENQSMRAQLGSQLYSLMQQNERNQISDEQWEKQYGLTKQQLEAELEAALYQREYQAQRDQVSDEHWEKEYMLKRLQADLGSSGTSSGYSGYSSGYSGGYSGGYSSGKSSSGYTSYDLYQKNQFEKERQASLAAIKAGVLNANESPTKTLGSQSAVNALYNNLMYGDKSALKNTSSSGSTQTTQTTQPTTTYNDIVNTVPASTQEGNYDALEEYLKKYMKDSVPSA
jgi:hypothetical protein